jgi:hypothetical protein
MTTKFNLKFSKHTRIWGFAHVTLLSKTALHSCMLCLPANVQMPLRNIKLENPKLNNYGNEQWTCVTTESNAVCLTLVCYAIELHFIVDRHIAVFIVVLPRTGTGLVKIMLIIDNSCWRLTEYF